MAQREAAVVYEKGNQRGPRAKAFWELEVWGESVFGSKRGK